MQKLTQWQGPKPEQVGSWVMMLMFPCLPPTPLLHPWVKCCLHWSIQTVAGNFLVLQTGQHREVFRGMSSPAMQQGGLLARCPVFLTYQQPPPLFKPSRRAHALDPPLQPEQTADAQRLFKYWPTRMQSKAALKVMLFVQRREELAGRVACGRA